MAAPLPEDRMIPTRPEPKFPPGTRVRVVHNVRVGDLRWRAETSGVVEEEGVRPVGGMEMGAKALYIQQPTLRLRRDDGEVVVVALDENSEVHPVE
jgi:hypothetical protein